ncbi:sigma-70 family RNA polymerase sigma factor [Bacillus sp. JCM 19041]|uniref:RNA polymerase sigma factor n=1 Tax=Bacillus sp. JCM 19041 TaxID=1460637 RepID=UPI0006CF78A1
MEHIFNVAWQRCESSIWKACLALTHHYHDAEDLLQTTWLKAYKSWSKKPHSLTKAYFTTVAKNAWIDEVRKKKIASVSFEDDGQSVADSTDLIPSLNVSHLLSSLVTRLTVRQQILFLLADVCRCSLKEIASLTNMSVGAVKAALFRARQKVSHEVREQLDEILL